MVYHTNHCWCTESNWGNASFDGEVMVEIPEFIKTASISPYTTKLQNPDWENLVIVKEFYNEKKYNENVEMLRRIKEDALANKLDKGAFVERTYSLKQELVDWLNENVQDVMDTDENTPLEQRKGWCTGNDAYNSKNDCPIIFFTRQLDALKFIRKFSIFKEPTFYFDYFMDKQTIEMSPGKILEIINAHCNSDINLSDLVLQEKKEHISQDMDYQNFSFIDWEVEDDETYVLPEKKELWIKELYAIQ